MKRRIGSVFMTLIFGIGAANALPHTGLYRTIDDETNLPKSIVAIYQYGDNTVAGRIVALYGDDGNISETSANAKKVASKVAGNPMVVGMDIIWDMQWSDKNNEYSGGRIMDPANGKVYSSVIWRDGDVLNVRGKIGPFGRTQHWQPISTSDVPAELQKIDTTNWQPIIRK